MRMMEVTRFGGPEVLRLRIGPDPVPGPGQVVIDVAVVPVLFLDTAMRRGEGRDWFPLEPPYVPGSGVAGTVRAVGDGVEAGLAGRPVVSDTGQSGAYADRVVVAADGLTAIPDGVALTDAAALLHDGRTALGLVDAATLAPGRWVLVTGATGGLGLLLVQLAHAAGARVVATARGERKRALVGELGADVVVDPSEPGWPEQVRAATDGRGPDVVFDGVGGETGRAAFAITAAGGEFSAHGMTSGAFAGIDRDAGRERGIGVRGIEQVQFPPPEGRRLVERALAAAAAGRLRPVVGQTFPLEQAAEAHARIEGRGVVGKTLLLVDGRTRS
jgi:NADPH2:quinone reductase